MRKGPICVVLCPSAPIDTTPREEILAVCTLRRHECAQCEVVSLPLIHAELVKKECNWIITNLEIAHHSVAVRHQFWAGGGGCILGRQRITCGS